MVGDTRFIIRSSPSAPRWFWDRLRQRALRTALWRLLRYVRPHQKYARLTLLFGVVGFLLSFVYPSLIGAAVDLVSANRGPAFDADRERQLLGLAATALGTAILQSIVVYGRGHFNVHLSDSIVTDLRRELFAHLQKLSVRFYTRERIGSILTRLLHDVHEATALIYTGIIVVALDCVELFIAVLLLSQSSWKLTLACLAIFPWYALIFVTRGPRVRRASERLHDKFTQISGDLAEVLAGQSLIKTSTAEPRELKRFATAVAEHHELVVQQSHEGHVLAALGEVLVNLGTTIVIGYGGWLAMHGELTAGQLTRYLGYVVIMYGPVRRFAELNVTYQSSLSAIHRVFRVFEIEPAIVEPAHAIATVPKTGDVCFDDVWFRYEDDTREAGVRFEEEPHAPTTPHDTAPGSWVLRGVSLSASHGERVAVVGMSGAGKTTLLSLLPRLYDVSKGRVLVDGIDTRDYSLAGLRSAIGIVQQESFLFSGSILENIAYGRPDASEAQVMQAATAAHAHEFISRYPDGYHTRLGERGVNLSGGQRQRLSIARAILKDPRILILDEATSSLDTESERVVQRALEELMQGRTSFIIAHRLSTIERADRIIVLEGGCVAEVGTHHELLARGGAYSRLASGQTSRI